MNGDLHQPPPLPPPQSVCEYCKSVGNFFHHNVALTPNSQPQKLCTSCLLQHYHKSCCAECFELYDANSLSPPAVNTATTTGNGRLLMCIRCDNWSHVNCPKANTPRSPYLCPLCSPGNFKYFDYRKPSEENVYGNLSIGKDEVKRLYAAARISVIIMNRAAAAAKLEADKKLKEAALAKKQAMEAIEQVFAVSDQVAGKKKEVGTSAAAGIFSAGPKIGNYTPVRLERNGGGSEANNVVGNVTVNGNGGVVHVPVPMSVDMPYQQNNMNGGGRVNYGGNVGRR